jgi:hypothetical protein
MLPSEDLRRFRFVDAVPAQGALPDPYLIANYAALSRQKSVLESCFTSAYPCVWLRFQLVARLFLVCLYRRPHTFGFATMGLPVR